MSSTSPTPAREPEREEQRRTIERDRAGERDEHGDAAEVRNRRGLRLERARVVDDVEPHGHTARERRRDQADDQRYDERHTSTSDGVPVVHCDRALALEAAALVQPERRVVVGARDDLHRVDAARWRLVEEAGGHQL